jgi:quercetin dioxygenase-like cupin family protein
VETLALGPHQTLTVVASSPEELAVEARWEPGGNPPLAHFHPSQEEAFEVLEGTLTVTVEGRTHEYMTGERFTVPAGAVHGMWNAGDAPARASWRVTPALKTEEMFRTIAAGGVEDFLERYADEFRLG